MHILLLACLLAAQTNADAQGVKYPPGWVPRERVAIVEDGRVVCQQSVGQEQLPPDDRGLFRLIIFHSTPMLANTQRLQQDLQYHPRLSSLAKWCATEWCDVTTSTGRERARAYAITVTPTLLLTPGPDNPRFPYTAVYRVSNFVQQGWVDPDQLTDKMLTWLGNYYQQCPGPGPCPNPVQPPPYEPPLDPYNPYQPPPNQPNQPTVPPLPNIPDEWPPDVLPTDPTLPEDGSTPGLAIRIVAWVLGGLAGLACLAVAFIVCAVLLVFAAVKLLRGKPHVPPAPAPAPAPPPGPSHPAA